MKNLTIFLTLFLPGNVIAAEQLAADRCRFPGLAQTPIIEP